MDREFIEKVRAAVLNSENGFFPSQVLDVYKHHYGQKPDWTRTDAGLNCLTALRMAGCRKPKNGEQFSKYGWVVFKPLDMNEYWPYSFNTLETNRFRKALRAWRIRREFTQKELAQWVGIAQPHLARMELTEYGISGKQIIHICDVIADMSGDCIHPHVTTQAPEAPLILTHYYPR